MALRDLTSRDQVENIVLFIADSVRYDHTPEKVRQQGVHLKGVAPSTFTASSIPSILSGTYPTSHQVWSFEDRLARMPRLFSAFEEHSFDYDEEFYIPTEIIRSPDRQPLDELNSDFLYIYHDRGGHFPYANPFEDYENMHSFFSEYSNPSVLRELYNQSVLNSAERFEGLVDYLQDTNRLDETLVIYISDHGELLGEYGNLFTHALPMSPELIHVPMVFAGAGLPAGQEIDQIASGVDIVPTIGGAISWEPPRDVEGVNLWEEWPEERKPRSEVWKKSKYDYLKSYKATSVWDAEGGYVSHIGPKFDRAMYSLGVHLVKGPHSQLVRRSSPINYWRVFKSHVKSNLKYGNPQFEYNEFDEAIEEFENSNSDNEEVNKERLRQLGYLE